MKYNKNLLKEIIIRDNCKIPEVYFNEKINCKTYIKFECECGNNGDKKFYDINLTGAFCKICIKKKRRIKVELTCDKKYGVSYSTQSDLVKKKIVATNLKKYGVENVFQNEQIKNKVKNTIKFKYGVDFITQSQSFKDKTLKTNIQKYGVEYGVQNEQVKIKIKNTVIERYGVLHVLQDTQIKNKMINTIYEKYGVYNCFQSPSIKQKIRNTTIERYGFPYYTMSPEYRKKCISTCLSKYGFTHHAMSPRIQERNILTCLAKYGVPHPMQDASIFQKVIANSYKSFKIKKYVFSNGDIRNIQGYENFALDRLTNDNILSSEIITTRSLIPKIWYTDKNNKKRVHYVDIYLPFQNRMIEVKSMYTYEKDIERIIYKKKAAQNLGYIYNIWIFNKKGMLINCL